ncbi:MAG: hypothetical protein ABGW69_03865, partial [Nanoarchaeota archaeon]
YITQYALLSLLDEGDLLNITKINAKRNMDEDLTPIEGLTAKIFMITEFFNFGTVDDPPIIYVYPYSSYNGTPIRANKAPLYGFAYETELSSYPEQLVSKYYLPPYKACYCNDNAGPYLCSKMTYGANNNYGHCTHDHRGVVVYYTPYYARYYYKEGVNDILSPLLSDLKGELLNTFFISSIFTATGYPYIAAFTWGSSNNDYTKQIFLHSIEKASEENIDPASAALLDLLNFLDTYSYYVCDMHQPAQCSYFYLIRVPVQPTTFTSTTVSTITISNINSCQVNTLLNGQKVLNCYEGNTLSSYSLPSNGNVEIIKVFACPTVKDTLNSPSYYWTFTADIKTEEVSIQEFINNFDQIKAELNNIDEECSDFTQEIASSFGITENQASCGIPIYNPTCKYESMTILPDTIVLTANKDYYFPYIYKVMIEDIKENPELLNMNVEDFIYNIVKKQLQGKEDVFCVGGRCGIFGIGPNLHRTFLVDYTKAIVFENFLNIGNAEINE